MLYFAEIIDSPPAGEPKRYRSTLAIRRFDARGRSLFLNGKRWLMRGIYDYGPVADVPTWREHASVRVIRRHNSSVMAPAAELGLMVVYRLSARSEKPEATVHSVLSPAVAMVLVPRGMEISQNIRLLAPNLLLAQEISAAHELQPWAHVAWMRVEGATEFAHRGASIKIPIIAERRYRGGSLAEARAAIDTLQADLAPIGQFAGYVV